MTMMKGKVPVNRFLKLILLPTVKTRRNDIVSLTEGRIMIMLRELETYF